MTPRAFVIAGPSSGAGKTTVALGLMAAFRRRGLLVQPFKCGPDFIDPGHHERVCGRPSRNLDGWMLSPAANEAIFRRHAAPADVSVVEGVMGLFDGANGSGRGSTAEMATRLRLPIVLVVDASKMAASAAALVHGFATFDPEVGLAGVIFNKVGSPSHYALLTDALARAGDAVPLGYLPRDEQLRMPERYLGLVTADEGVLSGQAVSHLADVIEQHVDLDRVLSTAAAVAGSPGRTAAHISATRVRIGIARDRAFSFYYEDNFDALRAEGADLIPFSPLHDRELPHGLDALYFGGGYPELCVEVLAGNVPMQQSVRRFVESGRAVYAECGGLMYLAQAIEGADRRSWPMVGVLPFTVVMTDRLQQFGYVEVAFTQDCLLGAGGTIARGHSFHCSRIAAVPSGISRSYRLQYTLAGIEEAEGFSMGSVLASYIHLHFDSSPGLAHAFVEAAARSRSISHEVEAPR
ncbi:MAG TPA: cobyrinate a,c-diamide synthase [Vicinamibacterales bacterium]|jgi:cobyrinic acid a,c-diamide synthase|nr:cobyrinate a,c-diamide synthase [Vicinamibacterales bacterium]